MPAFDRVAQTKQLRHQRLKWLSYIWGIVQGNPDHIESSSASKFGKYSLEVWKIK